MRWYNVAILAIVMMIRCMKGAIRVPNRGTIRRGVRQPNFVANGGVRSKYMASRVAINEKLPDYRTVLAEMNSVNVNTIVTPSLDNIRRIYDLCGKPLANTPVIHVGGTNGKGSVSAKIAEVLRHSGLRTGLFVSPHISSFRERAQVNGELISEEDVCSLVPSIISICKENDIPATFFDLTTIMSFLKFEREGCDAVVLEVGLGGELDSTNVLDETSLSILTSVQLDHVRQLGSTVEEIAVKKAGIIKREVPVLLGPGTPLGVLRDEARSRSAPAFELCDLLKEVRFNSSRDVDVLNQDIALAAVHLLTRSLPNKHASHPTLAANQEKVAQALGRIKSRNLQQCLKVRPPCRFQEFTLAHPSHPVRVVLDVAHNVDAIDALLAKVNEQYPTLTHRDLHVVLALSRDKKASSVAQSVLNIVGGDASRIVCVDATNVTHRALPAATLRGIVGDLAIEGSSPHLKEEMTVEQGIKVAVEGSRASSIEGTTPLVLVCGSGFIMSDARRSLGIVEPRD